jgi:hypothetical protein
MFELREVKCEICGSLLASGCCIHSAHDDKDHLCSECKKAVKDAKEQAKYLLDRKKNGD